MSHPFDEIRPVDISYILNNPWEISKNEWELNTETDHAEILSYLKSHLDLSSKDGFYKIWRTPSKKPIGILGCYKVEEKQYESFFFASKHMQEYGIKLTLEMRNLLKEQAINYKGCKCCLYSSSDHPKQISWFKFVGFEYLSAGNIGKARYFEYTIPS